MVVYMFFMFKTFNTKIQCLKGFYTVLNSLNSTTTITFINKL